MNKSKPFASILAALLLVAAGFVSCNSEESSSSSDALSNHCAINNAILGNMRRTVSTVNVYGRDTTYVTTVAGSIYPMYIDQYRQEIYNPDSLPKGTHVDKVVFSSISSDGILAYRTDWGTDTLYSTTDSLDFTQPRIITCYSYSGLAKKAYTVHVNVHEQEPEAFQWNRVGASLDALRETTAQRSFCKDGRLYVFALVAGEARLLTSDDGETWDNQPLSLNAFSPYSVQLFKGTFFALDGRDIVTSADGQAWASADANISADALPAQGSRHLFAVSNGSMYVSADGKDWQLDAVENAAEAELADAEFSSAWFPMSFNANFEYVLMAGSRGGHYAEWKKTIDREGRNTEPWSSYQFGGERTYPFPDLAHVQVLKYDEKAVALGCLNDTLSLFYVSSDAGRTWLPQRTQFLHPVAVQADNLSCVVDEDNYMWIFCGGSGQVWRGRLNRLGFKTNQTKFTK
ncbi:MAG: hypothetical protein ILA34_01055 [Bacteroidaceae bacterium]|nr:hypothetical protein [Bacteroidaceae bacterium]